MKNKRKAILLVGALLCLNLNIFSQNIPLKMNKVSVKKAMTELKEKSGYSFVYIAGDVDTKKIVNIDAEQLQEVIEQILEGQNVSYEIKDKKYHYSEEGSRTVHVEREKITRYFRACDGCYGRTYRRS